MSVLNTRELEDVTQKGQEYDYIRFSWPDLQGIPRGKTVPAKCAENFLKNGMWHSVGTILRGPRSELPFIEAIASNGIPNVKFVPATKVFDLSWAGASKYKVGEVICEAFWPNGVPVESSSRSVASRQLDCLRTMGYTLLSGFEAEFIITDMTKMEPALCGKGYASDLALSRHEAWLFDVEHHLARAGVDVDAIHYECSPGQFEFSMMPKHGMDTLDDTYIMKQAVKEIIPRHGYRPTFMAQPFANTENSFHFSHSLWDENGRNVFFDASQPNNTSVIMRYWVGGILKHAEAVFPLCSPTVNCFRRITEPYAPNQADWGIDNRYVALRVKTHDQQGTLVENRFASSACNPYLVAAVTIAAGIDGIRNKTEPPPPGKSADNRHLPLFEDCLNALEKDTVLVDALGAEFIDWWLKTKRQCELIQYGSHDLTQNLEVEMEKEREAYFDFI